MNKNSLDTGYQISIVTLPINFAYIISTLQIHQLNHVAFYILSNHVKYNNIFVSKYIVILRFFSCHFL